MRASCHSCCEAKNLFLLPCLHLICSVCIQDARTISKDFFSCTVCRERILLEKLNDLDPIFPFDEEPKPCARCSANGDHHFCGDCQTFLCKACLKPSKKKHGKSADFKLWSICIHSNAINASKCIESFQKFISSLEQFLLDIGNAETVTNTMIKTITDRQDQIRDEITGFLNRFEIIQCLKKTEYKELEKTELVEVILKAFTNNEEETESVDEEENGPIVFSDEEEDENSSVLGKRKREDETEITLYKKKLFEDLNTATNTERKVLFLHLDMLEQLKDTTNLMIATANRMIESKTRDLKVASSILKRFSMFSTEREQLNCPLKDTLRFMHPTTDLRTLNSHPIERNAFFYRAIRDYRQMPDPEKLWKDSIVNHTYANVCNESIVTIFDPANFVLITDLKGNKISDFISKHRPTAFHRMKNGNLWEVTMLYDRVIQKNDRFEPISDYFLPNAGGIAINGAEDTIYISVYQTPGLVRAYSQGSVLWTSTGEKLSYPSGIALSPYEDEIFVTSHDKKHIQVLDARTGKFLRYFAENKLMEPYAIAFTQDFHVLIAERDGRLSIWTILGTFVSSAKIAKDIKSIAVMPSGDIIFVDSEKGALMKV